MITLASCTGSGEDVRERVKARSKVKALPASSHNQAIQIIVGRAMMGKTYRAWRGLLSSNTMIRNSEKAAAASSVAADRPAQRAARSTHRVWPFSKQRWMAYNPAR